MSVEATMRRQRGLISRSQLRTLGVRPRTIESYVRRGIWERVQPGVYRHVVVGDGWKQHLLGATLASPKVVASHRSAAALFGIGFERGPQSEVSQPHGTGPVRLAGVRVHRSTQWRARQETLCQGIPCTGVERTIMDTAGTLGVDALERLAEEAVRRRLTTFGSLATYLAWHGKQGRTGAGTLRAMLLKRAPKAALPLSDFSRRVTQLLARHGVEEPLLEHRIYDASGCFILQADLAWPDRKRVVELDGLAWHFGRADVERDRRKRARARACGWRIHEVLWSMYAEDPGGLAAQIRDFLHSR